MEPLLFLDIDGVVLTARSFFFAREEDHFIDGKFDFVPDRHSAHAVRRIVEHTGCKIVINSTHGGWGEDHVRDMFLRVDYDISEDLCPLGWTTGFPRVVDNRSDAITKFLKKVGTSTPHVIIDDASLPDHVDNHVKTNPEEGITMANFREACVVLGKPFEKVFLL